MKKQRLLIHTCCAPCFCYVYSLFTDDYDVTAYYYNPNISPEKEYQKRLDELKRFFSEEDFSLIVGDYKNRQWTENIKDLKHLGEKSERCWQCYRIRLHETFCIGLEMGFDAITTSLSISPHKNALVINSIGKELESEFAITFIEADFKKNDGFKKSTILSRQYGFYRQEYCGCIYSHLERKGPHAWPKGVKNQP